MSLAGDKRACHLGPPVTTRIRHSTGKMSGTKYEHTYRLANPTNINDVA